MTNYKSLKYSQNDGKFTFEARDQTNKNLYKDLQSFASKYIDLDRYWQHLLFEVAYQLRVGETMTIIFC